MTPTLRSKHAVESQIEGDVGTAPAGFMKFDVRDVGAQNEIGRVMWGFVHFGSG